MDELILVERHDGPAVAGLLTALLAHWDKVPLNVQAIMIDHASRAAFDSMGRTDGRYVVTSFVLKHRARMARRERERDGFGFRLREAVDRMSGHRRRVVEAATQWPVSKWIASLRRAA